MMSGVTEGPGAEGRPPIVIRSPLQPARGGGQGAVSWVRARGSVGWEATLAVQGHFHGSCCKIQSARVCLLIVGFSPLAFVGIHNTFL